MGKLPLPSPEDIENALSNIDWDFSNQILYDVCASHPLHERDDVIMAKVMLIGRSYAASIERGRGSEDVAGDDFYKKKVVPMIRDSEIDKWFRELDKNSNKNDDVALNLEMHMRVMKLFNEISGLDKRSLASKYLHFHFRERFYIFDSRAVSAISKFTDPVRGGLSQLRAHDKTYAPFYLRCDALNERLARLVGKQRLLPRELDKVLLANC